MTLANMIDPFSMFYTNKQLYYGTTQYLLIGHTQIEVSVYRIKFQCMHAETLAP